MNTITEVGTADLWAVLSRRNGLKAATRIRRSLATGRALRATEVDEVGICSRIVKGILSAASAHPKHC